MPFKWADYLIKYRAIKIIKKDNVYSKLYTKFLKIYFIIR